MALNLDFNFMFSLIFEVRNIFSMRKYYQDKKNKQK